MGYDDIETPVATGSDILGGSAVHAGVSASFHLPKTPEGICRVGMVAPVGALQKAMACVAGKIINGLGETIKGLVESTLMEVVNFGVCAAEQFIGSLLNGIVDQISSGLESALGAVSKILGPAFKIIDFLTSSVDVLKKVKAFFTCNQTKSCAKIKEWTIGYGPKNKFLTRLEQNPEVGRKVAIQLPRLYFEMTGINYDAARKSSGIFPRTYCRAQWT